MHLYHPMWHKIIFKLKTSLVFGYNAILRKRIFTQSKRHFEDTVYVNFGFRSFLEGFDYEIYFRYNIYFRKILKIIRNLWKSSTKWSALQAIHLRAVHFCIPSTFLFVLPLQLKWTVHFRLGLVKSLDVEKIPIRSDSNF